MQRPGDDQLNAPESAAVVRLLVYSGVPDPEWSLDDAELEALAERVARSLQGPSTEPPPPWLLGYPFRRGHGNVLVALGVELPPTTAS